jgi:L-ribulokinase
MGAGKCAIGLDFGTNSVRALIVRLRDGEEIATAVANYPRGDAGIISDPANPHVARQHPLDYHEAMVACAREALTLAADTPGFCASDIIGVGVDTTGSTPIPVDAAGTPLALLPEFSGNPNALAWLWKDHSAMAEAETITRRAAELRPQYLAKSGGTYSSEWFFSKIWHCLNVDPEVFDAAHSWVEFCDYIPALLVSDTRPDVLKRGVCAAGHKAMYCEEWGGLPDAEFLGALDPKLAALRGRLFEKAYASDVEAGKLCAEWAEKLGLTPGIPVAVGAFDAHYGAVGSGVGVGTLVKILGTSTCDITVAPRAGGVSELPGVCGVVDGSVLPGCYGIEAGQSAVGDIFNWFVSVLCEGDASLHEKLTAEAAKLRPGQSGLLALDWNNGNRTILVDARLTGLLIGQTLHTNRAEVYRALIEATAFGALTIHNRLAEYGVPIERIVGCGGIAEKNPFFMQIYADVCGTPLQVSRSSQTCALGAAIFGAVVAGKVAGGYDSAEEAQAAMTGVRDVIYEPNPENHAIYTELYDLYKRLHDTFGVAGHAESLYDVMKALLDFKQRVTGATDDKGGGRL